MTVSIIVPVYNAEKYLHKCLDSILKQTYEKIEILLINDGSTDNSGKICELYEAQDNRVATFHTTNRGPAAARNFGIRKSKGEYIFFIDADDYIEKNAIELLVINGEKHDADITVGDFNKISESVSSSGNEFFFNKNTSLETKDIIEYTKEYLKMPNRMPLLTQSWGRLFRASIIRDNNIFFSPSLRTFEDVAFNFDFLRHTKKLFFLNETIYNFLIHTEHLSATIKMVNSPASLFGYRKALVSTQKYLENYVSKYNIEKYIGQAYVRYTIIQLIRLCMQIDKNNKREIYNFICQVVKDLRLRNGLKYYCPSKNDSRVIPLLLKLKFVRLIMLVCNYRGKARYKKRG